MPQPRRVPITVAGSPPTTTGMWKMDPAEARTVFGLVGSTVPSQHTTASTPEASAVRIMVPAFPGSRTSTQTTTNEASCNSARAAGTNPTTATTGWGLTVSAMRSMTPGARSKTRTPVA